MGYEILSDDLLANANGQQPIPQDTWFQRLKDRIIWFKLHLLTILIIALGIYAYFNMDFDFDLSFSNNETGILTLSGNFDTFSEVYDGNLEIDSTKFSIQSTSIRSQGDSGKINLKNFSGTIIEKNNSIIFNGTTDAFEFGNIKINTLDKNFILTSTGKTNTKLLLKSAYFTELSGAAKLDKTFSYEFENSSINITNYLTTFAYESGVFTFSGISEKFQISSPKHNLKINFDINQTQIISDKEK